MAKRSGKIMIAAAAAVLMTVTASASADAARFVLREYNGRVALFCGSEDEPAAVYQTQVHELYPADRELLEKGISLGSSEELKRLIGDLGLE